MPAAKTYLADIQLNNNQIINAVLHATPTDPTDLVAGKVWFNSTDGRLKVYSGTATVALTGIETAEVLKNKTINATENTLLNLAITNFGNGAISTDLEEGPTANELPTALAVKIYVDALRSHVEQLHSAIDGMSFKGAINAETNPTYPTATVGEFYKISVAGKLGGVNGPSVGINDTAYCTVENSPAGDHATVGANWVILQANVDNATTTASGIVQLAEAIDVETGTNANKAITPAALAPLLVAMPRIFKATVADTNNGTLILPFAYTTPADCYALIGGQRHEIGWNFASNVISWETNTSVSADIYITAAQTPFIAETNR